MPKKSVHVKQDDTKGRDELATYLQKALNDRQKDGTKVAHFLDEQDDPSTISEWISTGHDILDLAICNRKKCGLPVGRISEINGLESSGKSLLCAHIIAETQKKDGLAVMLDPEFAAAPEFWQAIGVKLKNLVYLPCYCLEDMLLHLDSSIGEVRKEYPDRLVTFITDSIASVPTKKELEGDYNVAAYGGDKSKILSLAMRKLNGMIAQQRICAVFTNQLRMNMKAMAFGDQYTEPGGMAFRYTASVRIRMKNIGRVTDKDKKVIGRTIQAQVTKTRFGPTFRTATFDIHYDSGIQNLSSWWDYLKEHNLITKEPKGTGFVFKMCDNKVIKTAEFVELANTNPEFRDKVYDAIADNYIMVYKPANSYIAEDVEHTELSEGEGEGEEKIEVKDE